MRGGRGGPTNEGNGRRTVQRIEPVVKDYAWGSRVSLAALSGRPFPTPTPEAELWVGAHEHGPALVVTDDGVRGLDAHIESDHAFHLGARCVEEFGRRLPFLLKILAADKALSIQAHPDADFLFSQLLLGVIAASKVATAFSPFVRFSICPFSWMPMTFIASGRCLIRGIIISGYTVVIIGDSYRGVNSQSYIICKQAAFSRCLQSD